MKGKVRLEMPESQVSAWQDGNEVLSQASLFPTNIGLAESAIAKAGYSESKEVFL